MVKPADPALPSLGTPVHDFTETRVFVVRDHIPAQAMDSRTAALVNALADIVVKATEYGTQDGEFVANYLIPTGPLHRAMPLLENMGVIVRPGFDGRTHPEVSNVRR